MIRPALNKLGFSLPTKTGHIINLYYSSTMETNGTNEQTHGYIAFRQDDTTWIELAEALDYLEWVLSGITAKISVEKRNE